MPSTKVDTFLISFSEKRSLSFQAGLKGCHFPFVICKTQLPFPECAGRKTNEEELMPQMTVEGNGDGSGLGCRGRSSSLRPMPCHIIQRNLRWKHRAMPAPFLKRYCCQKLSGCLTPHPFLPTPLSILLLLIGVCTDECQGVGVGGQLVGSLCAKSTPSLSSLPSSLCVLHCPPAPPPSGVGWGTSLCTTKVGGGCKQRITSDAPCSPSA